MKKFPQVKQLAWMSLVIQIGWMLLFMIAANAIWPGTLYAPMVGVLIYLVIQSILKNAIEAPLTKAMRLLSLGEFRQAIAQFEAAYAFYTRRPLIDRYRYFLKLSSIYTYREIVLIDLAACYSQVGEGEKSKQVYRRVLKEFPNNRVAQVSLKAIEAWEAKPR
jgi:tetratricopeptide (TPR) repeat protein